jgi:hypothetical protein
VEVQAGALLPGRICLSASSFFRQAEASKQRIRITIIKRMCLMRIIRIGFAWLLVAAGPALAQSDFGAITGTVSDTAGALMPGAKIEVRNIDTGTLHQVSSTPAGSYTIGQLPLGTYQLSVSVRGFKPYNRSGVTVLAAQTMRVDIVLAMLTSDEILTNDAIIKLVKVGINEDVIIAKIQESLCSFDLSVDGMVALKESGVSDRLMAVLMNPTKPPEAKPAPTPIRPPEVAVKPTAPKEPPKPAEPPAAAVLPKLPSEVGVYAKKGEQWAEIEPEVVTYHTSGAFARLATAGVVQNDLNGRVSGAHSLNAMKAPLEFLIVVAEGSAITEHRLIHFQQQRNTREFLAVIGGIFSSSGGATRDVLPYESTKVVGRTYSIKLPKLGVGEYGFLVAGGDVSSSKAGKIFTFRVTE